jgi:tetratricopeptide (TPR) repeat protein
MVNKTVNKEKIIIICFDPDNYIEDLRTRLDQINCDVVFHTELESCIHFIQSIEEQKIFLIIPSFRILTHFNQIDSIFIFILNNNRDALLSLENSKVIGIYDNTDLLYSSLQEQIKLIEKHISTWCFFDQNEYETKNLSKQSSNFLWLHLFHEVILHLPHNEQAKKQMMDACRDYYRDNLELLNEFEQNYQAKEALHWFVESLFLQKMINKALQTEDTDLLYKLRYFLVDLIENLAREHQLIVQSNEEKLIVYQEMKLSNDELNQFQDNKSQLISMKEFLTANTDRSSVLTLSASSLISVLFEIECNDNMIFADITQLLSDQKTILFDFNATFRIENIEQDEQILMIKLKAVTDGRTILRKYIDDTHGQIENLSIPVMFGKLICDMSQWNQSQIYFEHLLNDLHDEDVAWIEHSIGQVHHWKGEWNEARKYYDRAYDRMMQNESVRIKDSAVILLSIGDILYLQGKYEEGHDFHQRALTIQNEYYPSNHAHIATSLANIGRIYNIRLNYNEAFDFYKQALTIQEEYYDHFHIDIAGTLKNIGDILTNQQKFDEALDYYERAASIYEKYYPFGHVLVTSILNQIGYILSTKKKYNEALNSVQRALAIQKNYYPFGHISIAASLYKIGSIKFRQIKYDESLEMYQQTLLIQRKYYLSGHLEIVGTLNSIGSVTLYGKENYDEALHYHQQALTMLETYYPLYTARIGMTLNYIGNISKKQNKNDEARDYYHRALKIQQDYYLSDHIDMASVLCNIGHTLCNQQNYAEALHFLQRALKIQQDYYLSDHYCMILAISLIGIYIYKEECLSVCLFAISSETIRANATKLSRNPLQI